MLHHAPSVRTLHDICPLFVPVSGHRERVGLRLVFTTLHTHGFFSSLEGHSDCEEMMRVLLLSLLKCDVLTEELWLTG